MSGLGSSSRALPPSLGRPAALLRGWLEAYSQIQFGRSAIGGLLMALATFVVPSHGLAGLVGLVAADLWARVLGRPAEHIAEGYYGFNGLLVGLALGLWFQLSPAFIALMAVVSLLTVVFAAAARNLNDRYLGVPVLSLPFVIATWTALLATRRFAGVEITLDPVLVTELGAGYLPTWIELYLRSLGACFLQLSVASGALVFVGLLVISRWSVILSIVGFATGSALYLGLGGNAADLHAQFVGFNFILVAIAVGGVFVLLGPGSILLAAGSGALAAVISAAMLAFLEPFGLPVLALPFIVATQLLLFALLIGSQSGGLQLVKGEIGTPEDNLARAVFRARRYPDPTVPVLHLPVMGRWIVTQGPNGDVTHQGLWAHAWDFEVADDDGSTHRGDGAELENHYAWRAPVVAPLAGRVVRVVSHLGDNPPGEVDTTNNWGNLVILWHYGDVYSAVCHLQRGSVVVREGETVVRGQLLARVGNSGRSPVPHLHFQVQSSAEIGAPTRYAELLHYVLAGTAEETTAEETTDDETTEYVTHGVPDEGDCLAPVAIDSTTRQAATLAPGLTFRWAVREPGGEREEFWRSDIDALGARHLVSTASDARAAFYADDQYLTMLDYEGGADTLLGLFYLATPRLPYLADPGTRWTDAPSVRPFLGLGTRLAQELVLPFAPVGSAHTTTSVSAHDRGLLVTTRIEAAGARKLPDRIEVVWETGRGPVELKAWRGDSCTMSAEVVA